jgi:hypothetical protein
MVFDKHEGTILRGYIGDRSSLLQTYFSEKPIALSSDEEFFAHAENAGYNLRMRCVE